MLWKRQINLGLNYTQSTYATKTFHVNELHQALLQKFSDTILNKLQ